MIARLFLVSLIICVFGLLAGDGMAHAVDPTVGGSAAEHAHGMGGYALMTIGMAIAILAGVVGWRRYWIRAEGSAGA